MISLKAPGKIIWEICNDSGETLKGKYDYIVNQLVSSKVLGVKIINSEKIFHTDYFAETLKILKSNGIGIDLLLKGNELVPEHIDIINQYCDFLEIDITDYDCCKALSDGTLSRTVNLQLIYKARKQNREKLFAKLEEYKQFESMFQFFVVKPDYEVDCWENIITGEQVDSMSIDLINKAFEYEDNEKIIFIDSMDDIRALLRDRLIMSYLYMDYNGDIYINDVIKVFCFNIITQNLSVIWDQVKYFWNYQETKKFYRNILEEDDNNEKIFMAVRNTKALKQIITAIG